MPTTNPVQIKSVMHPLPHSIGHGQTADVALRMMKEHNIRHLPVQDGGKLIGILSDRDINFALRLDRCEPAQLIVADMHTPEPYVVAPDTLVADVAARMAHDHIGCALVVENHKLVGIFTTVDACRLLSEALGGKLDQ